MGVQAKERWKRKLGEIQSTLSGERLQPEEMSCPYPRLGEEWGRGTGLGIFNLFFLSLVGSIYIYFHKGIKLIKYTYKTTTILGFIIFCTYIRVPFTCSYTISLLQNTTFSYTKTNLKPS